MPSMVRAQEWTGATSTNWNTAANWQGGVLPGAGDVATIDNEGTGWPVINGGTHSITQVQIGIASGGGSLTIMGGGKLNLSQDANIGLNFAGSATVTGGGSQMHITDNLTVGYHSNGALTVSSDGLVTSRDGYVGGYDTSTDIATVTSRGQRDMSNELFIGYGGGGHGQLNITDGGSVTASQNATLGFGTGGRGSLLVDGATSYFSSESFIVGRRGWGEVTATDGSKIGSSSSIIGEQASSTGSVTIDSGATWEISGALTVGALGNGTLILTGGADLQSQTATIGRDAGGVGTATVSGAGTEWTSTGVIVIGRAGNGQMTLTDDAVVTSDDRWLGRRRPPDHRRRRGAQHPAGGFVGGGALPSNTGTGEALITGAGSVWNVGSAAYAVDVGKYGAGLRWVEDGGRVNGAVEVAQLGRLTGDGTVGDTTVDGVIAPGVGVGVLNVAGDITFNVGSIFEAQVNMAGQADLIAASGAAKIGGGTVQVLAGFGNYAPETSYTILTAAPGVAGTFGDVTSNLAFFDPALICSDPNDVVLRLTRNGVTFEDVGLTPNQVAAGMGTDSLGGGKVYDAILDLSLEQAQAAFDQLSGEAHASAVSAMIEDSRFVRSAVWDRMGATEQGAGYGVWGQTFGSWGHMDSDGNAATMERSIAGLFVSVDGQPDDDARLGLVAGYSQSSLDVKDRSSFSSSDNYHLGVYGGTEWGAVAFRSGLAYTWHDMDTVRNVALPGFTDSLTAGYDAGTIQAFTEVGYGIDLGTARLEPFANLVYVNFDASSFTEDGGAAALAGAGGSAETTFTTLGLRASTSTDMGETLVTAKGMVGWRHAFGDTTPSVTMNYASGSSAFTIGGVLIAHDLAVAEAGLDLQFAPTATLGVTYGGQVGSGVIDQSFKANLSVKF